MKRHRANDSPLLSVCGYLTAGFVLVFLLPELLLLAAAGLHEEPSAQRILHSNEAWSLSDANGNSSSW